jgi:hypothetical protein
MRNISSRELTERALFGADSPRKRRLLVPASVFGDRSVQSPSLGESNKDTEIE